MVRKHLDAKGKGEVDYDFKQDILFFKVKDREYAKSIELDSIVIDLDSEDFVTGIQIFEASKFLNTDKYVLRNIKNWGFEVVVEHGNIEIRLGFQATVRNKLVDRATKIIQPIEASLPNSELVCIAK